MGVEEKSGVGVGEVAEPVVSRIRREFDMFRDLLVSLEAVRERGPGSPTRLEMVSNLAGAVIKMRSMRFSEPR